MNLLTIHESVLGVDLQTIYRDAYILMGQGIYSTPRQAILGVAPEGLQNLAYAALKEFKGKGRLTRTDLKRAASLQI